MASVKITGAYGANLRSAPLFQDNILEEIPTGTIVEMMLELDNWYAVKYNLKSGYVHKSVSTLIVDPKPMDYVPHYGQWEADATTRTNDCGPTCCKMLIAYKTGKIIPVDNMKKHQADSTGLTSAADLVATLADYGVDAEMRYLEATDVVPVNCICLVYYGGFNRNNVWDKGFKGFHWLVHLEHTEVNGKFWHFCNDPDFAYDFLRWGYNHAYSEDEWNLAFVPIGNNPKRQIVALK